MNYIGSKLSLINFLYDSINDVTKNDTCKTFCDLFSGTGIVGSFFKQKGFSVIANDLQYYSYVLNKQYVENHTELNFYGLEKIIKNISNINVADRKQSVCDYLSNINGIKGFIYKNYSLSGTKQQNYQRQYFSDENAKRCDAIRVQIESWKNDNIIIEEEYFFLLTSLLEGIDKCANTASVYGAFLKKLKNSAKNNFILKPAKHIINSVSHKVYNDDANQLIRKIESDILYLDPPYNQRQYASNYHILETIARYDEPNIYGKTGLRDYGTQKSSYCSKVKVIEAFKDLILNAKSKYIFLSYNNEGLLSLDDIKQIMALRGKYGFVSKKYNSYKADSKRSYSSSQTIEYLHYVKCY